MKYLSQLSHSSRSRRNLLGSTLVEMMFASAILTMIVIALMAAHMTGLKEYQIIDSKSGSNDTSRRIVNQLPVDIRSSKMWLIGNYSSNVFSLVTNNLAQQGTALKLFPTTNNSTPYILYYFDLTGANSSNGKLMRCTSSNLTAVCLASNLVNWLGGGYSFVAEDYRGMVATNEGSSRSYKNVIHTTLQFCKFEYPLTTVGTNGLYDYYKIEFKVTPHLPE